MEGWEYPQTTFYTKPCWTAEEDPPHFFLHLHHLTSGLSQLSGSTYNPCSSHPPHRASCQQDLESKLVDFQYRVKTSRLEDGGKIFEYTGPAISVKFL